MPLDKLHGAAKKLDNARSFFKIRKRAMYTGAIAWNYYCDNLSDKQLIAHHSCSVLMCYPKCNSWQAAVCLGVSVKHYRFRKAEKTHKTIINHTKCDIAGSYKSGLKEEFCWNTDL